jgi:hypothetical protein
MMAATPAAAPPPEAIAIVDQLLRDRAGVLARIEAGRELAPLVRVLVATIAVGAALFGVAIGSYRGGAQIAYAAIKMPIALLVTAVVCAPTLSAVSLALGRPVSLVRDLALLVAALASGALVLLAEAPLVLAARAVELGYHRTILAASLCAAVAALASVGTLRRGVQARGGRGAGVALAAVALVFTLVGAQVSWTLRPFLVRPQTVDVPFVRELDGSLYDSLRTTLRSAGGVYGRHASIEGVE